MFHMFYGIRIFTLLTCHNLSINTLVVTRWFFSVTQLKAYAWKISRYDGYYHIIVMYVLWNEEKTIDNGRLYTKKKKNHTTNK